MCSRLKERMLRLARERRYKATIAACSTDFPISSARTCRLIFIDAVRGKSFSHTRYPPTRLKSGRRRLRDGNLFQQLAVECLILIETKDQHQRFRPNCFFGQIKFDANTAYSLTDKPSKTVSMSSG